MKKRARKKTKIVSTTPLVVVLVVVLVLIITFLVKNLLKDYRVNSEISEIEKQITEMEQENLKMTELSQYFTSELFLEEQARTRLGLKKPGEQGVVIENFDVLQGSGNINANTNGKQLNEAVNEETNDNIKTVPSYIKWWNYFFANKTNEE